MKHRYTSWSWWIRRIVQAAEQFLPARLYMPLLVHAVTHDGEPELPMLKDLVPRDRLAVDVGAAQGVYTWTLDRLASACWSFEANPVSAERVRKRVPRANVESTALSSADGRATLVVPRVSGIPAYGLASVDEAHPVQRDGSAVRLDVPVRTLDSYELAPVGFLKVDVEGHELEVLKGAERTIKRDHPWILVEVEDRHRPQARASVISWMAERGYSTPEQYSSQNLLFRPPAA